MSQEATPIKHITRLGPALPHPCHRNGITMEKNRDCPSSEVSSCKQGMVAWTCGSVIYVYTMWAYKFYM